MRRREKRLLQVAGLLVAALLFLPNVGLWSLYRDRVFDTSPGSVDGPGGSSAAQGLNQRVVQVGVDGVRRTDWHDYDAIRRDAARVGNGEQGKPFPLTESDQVDQAYRENGFNIYVSNRISLNRSLPDIRHENCKQKLYAEKLPNTSIIIPFHNEGWSSLLRTVHSVLNRSPPQLIAEIILVDDFSDKGTKPELTS
ncbi:polypeptide N-acetylgalactosaminyltransferase 10 [Austrofundulus limnaeus]|uniref:Polypeptide N-acetylgalactosaminyltransferase 10 n=1 Tax=Austrofundulus limnaeus TaxID=52670 RepID=A0A2I4AVL9_AUSLI|nr:PREDICTED: polypeptide N-acetylgalactosaminyltransferase 10 [Austrofundulus limnaeus]